MKFKTRKTWENDAGNQISQPLRQYEPESLEQIIAIIKEAEKHERQVRAIGSGHSWSDVGITTDFLVKPNRLNKVLDLEPSLLSDGVETSTLFRVESGITFRKLNDELDSAGLALPNMGGYDGQTIAGVISTSTHGTGIEFGPLSDIVISLEIVSDGGQVYRIEPADGVTNRVKYENEHPNIKLIQDDDWFNAVVVSMGCMGVIYSVILRVRDKFWLKEVRTLSTWDEVKEDLKQGNALKSSEHYEVLVNPHKVDGNHRCLITRRDPTDPPKDLPADKTNRNFLSEFLSSLPFLQKLANLIFNAKPDITDDVINRGMEALVDDSYIKISYKVFNVGVANDIPAISSEIGFPLKDNKYIEAVDRFLELAEEHKSLGNLYHTAPVSLRFVKASKAFLSMMHGYDTCMMEIILAKDTQGGFEMLRRYENELYKFSGRPHWGQVNSMTGSHDLINSMYPKYDKWIEIYEKLNKNGTFDSPFTKRVGFSKETFAEIL